MELIPCTRRGPELRPGVYECRSDRLLHSEPGLVEALVCQACPYRDRPDRASGPQAPFPSIDLCRHLGEILEHGACNVCGMVGQPFDVHACAVHGKCTLRRYRNDRKGLAVCLTCKDYDPGPGLQEGEPS